MIALVLGRAPRRKGSRGLHPCYPFVGLILAVHAVLCGPGSPYYGLYNTVSGIGIAAGNLLTGAAIDAGRGAGIPGFPWMALAALGGACGIAVRAVDRAGHLTFTAGRRRVSA